MGKIEDFLVDITINISDDVYHRAKHFASLANRDLSSVIADTLAQSFPATDLQVGQITPVANLSDAQVMALTQLAMEPLQDARLSLLLDKQQSASFIGDESKELEELMQIYREGLLRKATALAEAVKRGLMEPLDS
jgi:hypothetical protein